MLYEELRKADAESRSADVTKKFVSREEACKLFNISLSVFNKLSKYPSFPAYVRGRNVYELLNWWCTHMGEDVRLEKEERNPQRTVSVPKPQIIYVLVQANPIDR